MHPLSFLQGVLLGGLLTASVGWDLRTRRIPNALTGAFLLAALLLAACHGPASVGLALLGMAAAGLALPLWAARLLGAGDVKLLAAVGALLGPTPLLWTLLGTAIAGAVLAALTLARRGTRIPYSPAVALGTLWAVFCIGRPG